MVWYGMTKEKIDVAFASHEMCVNYVPNMGEVLDFLAPTKYRVRLITVTS